MPRIPAARCVLALLLACWACAGPEDVASGDVGSGPVPPPLDTLLPVGGIRLFVHAEGDGPPVVVVHGGPVLDHGYLVEPLRPLAATHRLVFFDQRVSGRSDPVADSASMRLDTLVADIEGVRVVLGLDRIHVLGHSWGGLLALEYALTHPERTASLILVSPMAPSAELWQEEEAILAAALQPGDTAGMGAVRASDDFGRGDPAAIERLLQLSFRAQLADPALADSLRFHIEPDYRDRSRRFGWLVPDLMAYDLTPDLPGLRPPTLIVYGDREPGAAVGADTLRTLLPGARIEILDGVGHFAFLERPGAFLERVRVFLGSCCG